MELPPMRPQSAMPMPIYHQQQQPLTGIEHPHNNDVLCGRGVTTNRHVGNESFRSLVNCNKELYVTSTKKQKMKISRSIVEAVRSLEPPGRFLEKDQNSGKWFDIGDKKAVEKTSQALRDGAAGLRKQLSEDLSDPDFLSAVFDMDVVPPEKNKAPNPKKDKKQPPKKGHRRTKSNPTPAAAGKSKNLVRKQHRGSEVSMSPRTRHSISVSMCGKPPQSPGPMSPSSVGGSPRMPPPMSMDSQEHRRVYSHGSAPVHVPTSPSSFYPTLRPSQRSSHFEYHDNPEHRRPPPAPYGSPSPHYPPPPPRSPSAHPGSPYGRPYHPPISPRWSPRSGYSRSGHALSPHPYMHPSDFHRRHSPDHRPHHPSSPRDHYARPHPHYPPSHGPPRGPSPTGYHGSNHHLAVPSLGSERGGSPHSHHPRHLPMSPGRYPHHPASPRHSSSPHVRSSPLPVDFTPPQTYSRHGPGFHKGPEMPVSMDEEVYADEKKEEGDERPERSMSTMYSKEQEAAPFDEKPSSESPSAVADVAESNSQVKPRTALSSSKGKGEDGTDNDDYPSDEDPDPAAARCLSPLPFDSHEDPCSLMELPENILSLPISPCGPNDGEI